MESAANQKAGDSAKTARKQVGAKGPKKRVRVEDFGKLPAQLTSED
ncbi:MAG: hypothetical protein JXQ73_30255 [Phycisphaerae bacterium]|nr:hypothetical protein [Phycisphaerae bacterium]